MSLEKPTSISNKNSFLKNFFFKKPLAIGMAIVSGNEMAEMEKGKAIRTIHWVGDELWELET